MKIETFQIILQAAAEQLQGGSYFDPELSESPEQEADRLLGILEQQKADGATRVGFQFEKRKHSRKANHKE